MKAKSGLSAFTLVEVLIVIILSGVLCLVLFDGLDLVKRSMYRVKQTLFDESDLLDNYCYLEGLFQRCDSVSIENSNKFSFYWENELKAVVEIKDSLVYTIRHGSSDTLLRKVTGFEVRIQEPAGRVDSLSIWFLHKGRFLCFPFGIRESVWQDDQERIKKVEDQYNNTENNEWSQKL